LSGRACARQARPHSLTAWLQTTSGALLGFGLGCRCRRRFSRRRGGRFLSRRFRRRRRFALATADDHHGHQQTHTQTSQPPLTHSHGHALHRGSRVVFAYRPARRRPPRPRGPRGPARTERAGLLYHSPAVSTDFFAASPRPLPPRPVPKKWGQAPFPLTRPKRAGRAVRCARPWLRAGPYAPRAVKPSIQDLLAQARHFHEMPKQAGLERLVAVYRHGKPNNTLRLAIDMVASVNSQERPSVALQNPAQRLAGERFHTTISRTRSLSPPCGVWTSTERHPSTAS